MQRGSSGATINMLGERVVKIHKSERLVQQGLWLQRHRTPLLPEVYKVSGGSYEMERLVFPPPWALDHKAVFLEMMQGLKRHVWSRKPEVEYHIDAITCKYGDLCEQFGLDEIAESLDKLVARIRWERLRACLTHGDPTFDNVMFRPSTGDLVLIDPIPASPAVPDLRAVDYGKILMSILGWEKIRYGSADWQFQIYYQSLWYRVSDDNEWLATVFWAIVHLLRAMPYVDNDLHARIRGGMRSALRMF